MLVKAKVLKDFTYSEDGISVKMFKKGSSISVLSKHKNGLVDAGVLQGSKSDKEKIKNPVNVIKDKGNEDTVKG